MPIAHLYVIRLADEVSTKPKIKACNPNYCAGKPCYYVGASKYPPQERFRKHKEGERSSKWVRDYGLYVVTRRCRIIEVANGIERQVAERNLANELRKKGYGIWQK
jgi:Uri superfamily endonuclease